MHSADVQKLNTGNGYKTVFQMHVRVLNRHMYSIDVQYGACDGSKPSHATTNAGNRHETVFRMHLTVLNCHRHSTDVQKLDYSACDTVTCIL
jgi:hypothetical protein